MTMASYNGLTVLALESRRAREIARLIENLGGVPIVAPSVREVELDSNKEALEFASNLAAGLVDMVIFTTGVGVKALASAIENTCPREDLTRLLNGVDIVARGPKPTAALKELGVSVDLIAPEPNTWRELLAILDQNKISFPVADRRVAVQEYGVTNPELSTGLAERGAIVTLVNVYQWALPEDLAPLQQAIESIIRGDVHVLLVASSVQIRHLFEVARQRKRADALGEGLTRVVIASVGPLTSDDAPSRGKNLANLIGTEKRIGRIRRNAIYCRTQRISRAKRIHQSSRVNSNSLTGRWKAEDYLQDEQDNRGVSEHRREVIQQSEASWLQQSSLSQILPLVRQP
jgi:uroporphyrinogen-III synthase